MKWLAKIVLTCLFFSSLLEAANSIKAMRVLGNVSNISPISKAWLSSSFYDVILYPQTTLKVDNLNKKAKKARVKAIFDGKNISFLIQWKAQESNHNMIYKDGIAVQFPVVYSDAKKLPYIGMGDTNRAVTVYLQKATLDLNKIVKSGYQGVFTSRGYGSMIQTIDNTITNKMQMIYKNGFWRATLSRAIKATSVDFSKGVFPVSFALWDGEQKSRDGLKWITPWIGIKLATQNSDELLDTLQAEAKGDLNHGKKIALENCTTCHRYDEFNKAPQLMAPNLSNIGGYSTKEYIKESLLLPSAVIVTRENSSKEKNFFWYDIDLKGIKVSTMPSYDWLDKKSIDDLVAYLTSLKAELE